MKLGDIYRHKTKKEIIQIDCFATHVKGGNPLGVIIVYTNIYRSNGECMSCPSFNGYGTQEEIEDEYELLVPTENLQKFGSWEEIYKLL